MSFAEYTRGARICSLFIGIVFALNSCAEGLAPLSKVPAPTELVVEPVKLGTMRLSWTPVPDADVVGYSIERRANLSGPFLTLVAQMPQTNLTQAVYLDTNLDPDSYYGYRLYTITRFGDRSSPSVVGGAKSPPLPGIAVTTSTIIPSAESVDPDGYDLTITGPDTVRQAIGISATQRFSPLRLGEYQVTLGGVTDRCVTDGQSTQSVTVSDQTAQTVVPVEFHVTCRDPNRGEITVVVTSTGTSLDGVHLIRLVGEASDETLPDSARLVARTQTIGSSTGSTRFINLRPGSYEVTLEGLAPNCQLEGEAIRRVTVAALDNKEVRLNVSCSTQGGGDTTAGYHYHPDWTALAGDEYALDLRIDMRTFNRADITDVTNGAATGDPLTGAQVIVAYDASKLSYTRYENSTAPSITTQSVNGSTPGSVNVISAVTGLGPTGDVGFGRLIFTRIAGATGTVSTATTLQAASSRTGSPGQTINITADVRLEEGTVTLGSGGGGGGGTNQSPIARANGPYTGTVGTALSLSSVGSSDPDGTIASYSWALGNGQIATGASPSVTYSAAGTFTVVLTVTDDKGATGTSQTTVTISGSGGGGGGNGQPPGYQYLPEWTALPGDEYALDLYVDMRAFNRADITDVTTSGVTGDPLTGAQVTIAYDATRLAYNRYEGAPLAPRITTQSVNGVNPGSVAIISAVAGLGPTGKVGFGRLIFTRVAGSPDGSVATATTLQAASSRTGSPGQTVNITADVRVNEDTLVIGAGGGATNQSPVARANGPYTGTVNTPLTLSSVGSSDPDGTIASYSWALGNGQTANGASPSVTYSAAGTFIVVLTVTDDKGAAGTSQTTVTITGGTTNQPPTAEANGPYSATVGVPITLSSTGSSDTDGSIASYAWALGNGQTATGSSPSVTYSTAGTFTVVLTVTDDKGATSTDQATVTVSNPTSTKPLIWKNVFGPVDVANGQVAVTVSYDMRGNVTETPGAEVLASFKVDSLKWDPAVLQFSSINLGPNIVGTSNQAGAGSGKLAFQGTTSGALAQGLITIATIRFKIIGATGSHTTTETALGVLQGAPVTGDFVYNSKTAIVEGEFFTP